MSVAGVPYGFEGLGPVVAKGGSLGVSRSVLVLFCLGYAQACLGYAQAQSTGPIKLFESKIRPLFVSKCLACHSDKVQMAGLVLTTAEGFQKGAESGPVVSGTNPGQSRLIRAVRYLDAIKMPPTGKLASEEIRSLEEWVSMGAPWPKLEPVSQAELGVGKNAYWAFRPLDNSPPPSVKDESWAANPIDHFIQAGLEEKGLDPALPAGKLTLLRRATYDLHGLPPTETEIDQFLADTAPGAFTRLVDRLLASPRYGERWGRHWLDVARYATSTGVDEDHRYPYAWRYRDYVIDAFNHDLPYDQFVREQIAGDLLPAREPGQVNQRGIIATGFLALGPKAIAQQDRVQMVYDVVDEQIDTVSKAFLGLTIACARCHDHKFDPILNTDYYSLASIFASSQTYADLSLEEGNVVQFHMEPLVPADVYEHYRKHQDKIETVEKLINATLELESIEHMERVWLPRIVDYMLAARSVYVGGHSPETAAQEANLDVGTLKKWAEYLDPGDQLRLYLEEWHDADAANARSVAEKYRQRFAASSAEWREKVAEWKATVQTAYGEGAPAPKRPLTDGFKDRFHEETAINEGGAFYIDEEQREEILSAELRRLIERLRAEQAELKESAPPQPPMASAVVEGEIIDQPLFLRGNHHNHGEVVPKEFPRVLAGSNQRPVTQGSGRRELAEWLVTGNAALTSRVMVNRIWHWHFGRGLVRTTNNFGKVGERPTHPRLLDYLARQFIDSGWSIKHMHRLIMLSSAYRISSRVSDDAWRLDPDNRLSSRFDRRRLSIEELRDSILALAGSLDLTMGGTLQPELGDSTKGSSTEDPPYLAPEASMRRTVYLPLYRNRLPKLLSLFDFVDSTSSTGQRSQTNIAPQGLFVMNSKFFDGRGRGFAERLLDRPSGADSGRVERAYLMALARKPTAGELQFSLDYVRNYPSGPVRKRSGETSDPQLTAWQGLCRILMASNEFHYVD